MVLGDSLSAGYGIPLGKGWVSLLQQKLQQESRPVEIINASISGDTSANGLMRLPTALDLHQPDIVLIELGGNDGLRGLPISYIRKNLSALITTAQEAQTKVALMAIQIPPNYGKKYTSAFSSLYPELSKQYQISLLPFMIEDIALNPELMQVDGIHPNEQAQSLIVQNIWPEIEKLINN
jgi:acyl-CoA thioesterase-1